MNIEQTNENIFALDIYSKHFNKFLLVSDFNLEKLDNLEQYWIILS